MLEEGAQAISPSDKDAGTVHLDSLSGFAIFGVLLLSGLRVTPVSSEALVDLTLLPKP